MNNASLSCRPFIRIRRLLLFVKNNLTGFHEGVVSKQRVSYAETSKKITQTLRINVLVSS